MKAPWVVPVGGFLGAGKTTLVLTAARVLAKRGLKCAAIMNDQAGALVDTAYVESQGLTAGEVTGGCFCCRFNDLMESLDRLRAIEPDVVFIEPVGSCTDLSATILQPLKREFGRQYRLAPLTVVVDPTRAPDLEDASMAFLFERQIAEADLLFVNMRGGRLSRLESQGAEVRYGSALSEESATVWIDEVLGGTLPVGGKLLNIDYRQYAEAEATLGWLNWSATLHLHPAISPAALMGPWTDDLQQTLRSAGARIAHLKVFDQTQSAFLKAAVRNNTEDPIVEGDLTASPETEHLVRLNLRAVIDAAALHKLFSVSLLKLPGQRSAEQLQCFSPAAPKPEHRYAEIVD